MNSIFVFLTLLPLLCQIITTINKQPQNRDSLRWVQAHNGYIPFHAILAGDFNRRPLYFARATTSNATYIGYIVKGDTKANIVVQNGNPEQYEHYQVLVGSKNTFHWVDSSQKDIFKNAIKGGQTQDGTPLYFGTAVFRGNTYVGWKLQVQHAGLKYYDGTTSIESYNFQLISFTNDEHQYQYQFYDQEYKKYKLEKLNLALEDNKKEHSRNQAWMIIAIASFVLTVSMTIAIVIVACKIRHFRRTRKINQSTYHATEQERDEAKGQQYNL